MTVRRGERWLADLDPARGSEQTGSRPVLVVQNDVISKFTTTVLTIPLTTNLRRASLPSCVLLAKGEGGLAGVLQPGCACKTGVSDAPGLVTMGNGGTINPSRRRS